MSISICRLGDIQPDFFLSMSNFTCDYDIDRDSWHFAVMPVISNSSYVWDVAFSRIRNTTPGASQNFKIDGYSEVVLVRRCVADLLTLKGP